MTQNDGRQCGAVSSGEGDRTSRPARCLRVAGHEPPHLGLDGGAPVMWSGPLSPRAPRLAGKLIAVTALLWSVLGCGSVSVAPQDAAGGAPGEQGGASGAASAAGTAGAAGAAGAPGANSAGTTGGAGTAGAGGEIGDGGAHCLSNNTPGFAFNPTCDGGQPASDGCHASCELAGAHYTGCTAASAAGPAAFYCYATCAACP